MEFPFESSSLVLKNDLHFDQLYESFKRKDE